MVRYESCPSKIGPINLGKKQTGAPSAVNPHAGCDVAGAGNGFTVWLLRHSQRKQGETARPDLRDTAPVLDPTRRVKDEGRAWIVADPDRNFPFASSVQIGGWPRSGFSGLGIHPFRMGGLTGTSETWQWSDWVRGLPGPQMRGTRTPTLRGAIHWLGT
jgi:hypothetical protein